MGAPPGGGPGNYLIDERTSDATTAVCRCHCQLVEEAFAVDHPRHRKADDRPIVVDRHPGPLLGRRLRQSFRPVGRIVRGSRRCVVCRSRGTVPGRRLRPPASSQHHRPLPVARRSATSRGPSTPCAQIARSGAATPTRRATPDPPDRQLGARRTLSRRNASSDPARQVGRPFSGAPNVGAGVSSNIGDNTRPPRHRTPDRGP